MMKPIQALEAICWCKGRGQSDQISEMEEKPIQSILWWIVWELSREITKENIDGDRLDEGSKFDAKCIRLMLMQCQNSFGK
jgi:hypothetical protein